MALSLSDTDIMRKLTEPNLPIWYENLLREHLTLRSIARIVKMRSLVSRDSPPTLSNIDSSLEDAIRQWTF